MARQEFNGICVAISLLWATTSVRASEVNCYCAKMNESEQFCGELIKFDPDGEISIRMGTSVIKLPSISFVGCPVRKDVNPTPTPAATTASRAPIGTSHFGICGSNTIGERLMPALIKGFALKEGFIMVDGGACNGNFLLRSAESSDDGKLSIECRAEGTHTGIPALAERRADIAMLSRPLTSDEEAMMSEANYSGMRTPQHENVIALDGLLVIVSPQNSVRALSLVHIAKIFAGEITDWAQLGGTPGRIELYARDTESGTRDSFEAMVMEPHRKQISPTARLFRSSSDLSDAVKGDRRGIGFVGFAYKGAAKALAIAEQCGIEHNPSALEIKTEDYPLSRRLFLYTARLHSHHSQHLVHYALSDAAQPVIETVGYVNQKITPAGMQETRARVAGYVAAPTKEAGLEVDGVLIRQMRAAAEKAERLSVSFRFRPNTAKLDTKALQDVVRLGRYVRANARDKKIMLLGFADAQGPFTTNLRLSQQRADAVRVTLLESDPGLSPDMIVAKGYSELMPVACNADDAGRERNRRVEVWLIAD